MIEKLQHKYALSRKGAIDAVISQSFFAPAFHKND